jgi:hypothetical protein
LVIHFYYKQILFSMNPFNVDYWRKFLFISFNYILISWNELLTCSKILFILRCFLQYIARRDFNIFFFSIQQMNHTISNQVPIFIHANNVQPISYFSAGKLIFVFIIRNNSWRNTSGLYGVEWIKLISE